MTKDELIAAARDAAARTDGVRLSFAAFRRLTGISHDRVYRRFASWAELCDAAGLPRTRFNGPVPDERIFRAMRDAFLACGGVPSRNWFLSRFAYSRTVLNRRFVTWEAALDAFRGWAEANDPSFPFLAALRPRRRSRMAAPRAPVGPRWASRGGRAAGDLVAYRGLARAPVNEHGVVLAFGMVADALGYSVEGVGAAFPDCVARRLIGDGRWEEVRIEFEFKSRNFRDHGHDATGCELIVCWEHDWADCPLEVLELKSAIATLRGRDAATGAG